MDQIAHVSLRGGVARALIATSTDLVAAAQQTHHSAPTATAALGRCLTAAALMATQIKEETGSVTLSFRGDGPLGGITCVGRPGGMVKGYVNNPSCDVERLRPGKLNVGLAVGQGYLSVIRDFGKGQPYIGQTEIRTGEIAEDLAYYFALSEQKPSLVCLGVMLTGGMVTSAAGMILQPLPDATEEDILALEGIAQNVADISQLAQGVHDIDELCSLAFSGVEYALLERLTPSYVCDCSSQRMERALISLGRQELNAIIEQDHGATMHCHFCNNEYTFSEEQLLALLNNL